ncbi:MAG: M42 family metallopeptidase [Ignavibacteriales bacterium]
MLLKDLTLAKGISGDESDIRKIIKSELNNDALETFTDNIGNLLVTKNIEAESIKVLVTAHMDEVGLMITMINDNGSLKFKTIGSIDERVLASKRFYIGSKRVPGVIGTKPVHLIEDDEKKQPLKAKALYIDIGCNSKEEAEKLVEVGDYAYFDSDFVEMENKCIKSKAFDNRVGCNLIIDILKESYNVNLQACFSAQEEIGARGSGPAVRRLKPDCAIIIEGTSCSDVPGTEERNMAAKFNNGPVISKIDKSTIASKKLFDFVLDTARKYDIKYQIKEGIYGGNDSDSIQFSEGGIPTVVISIPCRYIHSPNSIMSLYDYSETTKLIKAVLNEINYSIIGG